MMPAREGEVAPDYVLTVKSSKDKIKCGSSILH